MIYKLQIDLFDNNNKMWVLKYDYNALKLEFFQSDFDEVQAFFEHKWSNPKNWNILKNTKGWAKEKKEWKWKIIEKALEEQLKKEAKDLSLPIWFLMKAKKNAIIKIAKQITEDKLMSMKDLVRWLWTIKTELWEPTKITKNENHNTNTEELSEEDELLLEKIFGNKNGNKSNWKNERETI